MPLVHLVLQSDLGFDQVLTEPATFHVPQLDPPPCELDRFHVFCFFELTWRCGHKLFVVVPIVQTSTGTNRFAPAQFDSRYQWFVRSAGVSPYLAEPGSGEKRTALSRYQNLGRGFDSSRSGPRPLGGSCSKTCESFTSFPGMRPASCLRASFL